MSRTYRYTPIHDGPSIEYAVWCYGVKLGRVYRVGSKWVAVRYERYIGGWYPSRAAAADALADRYDKETA